MPFRSKLYEDARAETGPITIAVDLPGADVVVDGKVVGKSPLEDPVFVEPGHHTIEARLGAKPSTLEGEVAQGGLTPSVRRALASVQRHGQAVVS